MMQGRVIKAEMSALMTSSTHWTRKGLPGRVLGKRLQVKDLAIARMICWMQLTCHGVSLWDAVAGGEADWTDEALPWFWSATEVHMDCVVGVGDDV